MMILDCMNLKNTFLAVFLTFRNACLPFSQLTRVAYKLTLALPSRGRKMSHVYNMHT